VSGPAPARACAYRVIRRVLERGAFADRALHSEASGLSARDRSLATILAYGTVQRARTLDHVIDALCSRPASRLDLPVLAALRMGVFQLVLLDGIAEHAAVNDSVELVAGGGRGGAGLVNAVLRRAAREGRQLLAELDDSSPAGAAVLHSVPDWLAERWWEELGPCDARALLRAVNEPAESAVRINELRAPLELELPVRCAPAGSELPEGRVLLEPFDAFGSTLWREGRITPQSRGSMLVARELGPLPGERVLDLCAAPGAKTTHLAALMQGRGSVTAVEVHSGRAAALRATCERQGASNVEVRQADARAPERGRYDRVLVDPPCSGLGTLQSRPDLRWQPGRRRSDQLAERQRGLLEAAVRAAAAGATIVYSVCTISRAESQEVVHAVLGGHGGLSLESERQLLPHRDGTDGFYIARLRRGGGA
jgi:16S rRNA (cytosine967-C5)-methyltransferase